MGDDRASKRAKLDTLEVDANEAIGFELTTPGSSSESAKFGPEMMHQLFGDDEMIKGHEEPEGTVAINHHTFEYFVEFKSKSSISGATKVCFIGL